LALEQLKKEKGKKGKTIIHELNSVDVQNIRAKVGMSQIEFVSAFGISFSALQHWEWSESKAESALTFPTLVILLKLSHCSAHRYVKYNEGRNECRFRAWCRRLTGRPKPSPHFCPAGIA